MKIILQILFISLIIVGCKNSTSNNEVKMDFSVNCISLCDEEEFRASCYNEIGVYQNKTYYDKTVVKTDSTLIITFDFIDNCCLNFTGRYEVKDETLELYYFLNDDENLGCDCQCNYRMIYQFENFSESWRRIKIMKVKKVEKAK